MEKIIRFEEGRSYRCRASAFTPIQYGKLFPGHDYLRDIERMYDKNKDLEDGREPSFTTADYEMFVQLTYVFVYQGLSESPRVNDAQREFLEQYPDPWTWIDSFDSFSIYEILPEITELWIGNEKVASKAKNQNPAPPEK